MATVRIGRPCDRVEPRRPRSCGCEHRDAVARPREGDRPSALPRIGSHDGRLGDQSAPRTQGCATLTFAWPRARAEGSGRHGHVQRSRCAPSSSGSADACRLREHPNAPRALTARAMLAGMHESRPTEKGTPRAEFSLQRTQHRASRLARRRPTLPLTYASSTIGSGGLDFRVRDGIGYGPSDVATGRNGSVSLDQW